MATVYTLEKFDRDGLPYPTTEDIERAERLQNLGAMDMEMMLRAYKYLSASYYALARCYKEKCP